MDHVLASKRPAAPRRARARWLGWLLVALAGLAGPAKALRPDFTLKISMEHSDMVPGRPFLYEEPLTRKQFRDLEFNKNRKIKPYILKAQKALAKKMGYHEKIYGPKALTYIHVTRVIWQVRDEGRRKIVLAGKGK